MTRNGITVFIINASDNFVEVRKSFFYHVLKGIGSKKLSVDNDSFTQSISISQGLNNFFVTSCSNSTKIMSLVFYRGGGVWVEKVQSAVMVKALINPSGP